MNLIQAVELWYSFDLVDGVSVKLTQELDATITQIQQNNETLYQKSLDLQTHEDKMNTSQMMLYCLQSHGLDQRTLTPDEIINSLRELKHPTNYDRTTTTYLSLYWEEYKRELRDRFVRIIPSQSQALQEWTKICQTLALYETQDYSYMTKNPLTSKVNALFITFHTFWRANHRISIEALNKSQEDATHAETLRNSFGWLSSAAPAGGGGGAELDQKKKKLISNIQKITRIVHQELLPLGRSIKTLTNDYLPIAMKLTDDDVNRLVITARIQKGVTTEADLVEYTSAKQQLVTRAELGIEQARNLLDSTNDYTQVLQYILEQQQECIVGSDNTDNTADDSFAEMVNEHSTYNTRIAIYSWLTEKIESLLYEALKDNEVTMGGKLLSKTKIDLETFLGELKPYVTDIQAENQGKDKEILVLRHDLIHKMSQRDISNYMSTFYKKLHRACTKRSSTISGFMSANPWKNHMRIALNEEEKEISTGGGDWIQAQSTCVESLYQFELNAIPSLLHIQTYLQDENLTTSLRQLRTCAQRIVDGLEKIQKEKIGLYNTMRRSIYSMGLEKDSQSSLFEFPKSSTYRYRLRDSTKDEVRSPQSMLSVRVSNAILKTLTTTDGSDGGGADHSVTQYFLRQLNSAPIACAGGNGVDKKIKQEQIQHLRGLLPHGNWSNVITYLNTITLLWQETQQQQVGAAPKEEQRKRKRFETIEEEEEEERKYEEDGEDD